LAKYPLFNQKDVKHIRVYGRPFTFETGGTYRYNWNLKR